MSMFLLKPAVKKTIWGGTKLKSNYNIETELDSVAEAWVLSCHPDGESTIVGTEYDGMTLSSAINMLGKDALGSRCKDCVDFPILIKLIDAKDKLSIQVHPDDAYAQANEKDKRGKTEAWYILDSDKDASLIYGFKENITKQQFEESIVNNTLLDYVNSTVVKPGDVAFIKSGTLHAIGAGILLAEVQQSCNTTYRVYDYNRPGLDGKPRELHIKKAVDVTNCVIPDRDLSPEGETVIKDGYSETLLCECEYFNMTAVEVTENFTSMADDESFVSVIVLDGNGVISCQSESIEIKKGNSIFITASSGEYTVSGRCKLLISRV